MLRAAPRHTSATTPLRLTPRSASARALFALCALCALCVIVSGSGCSGADEAPSLTLLDLRFFHPGGQGLPATSPEIDALRVTVVDASDKSIIDSKILVRDDNGESTFYSIPYREGLQFFVEALDTADNILLSGGSRPLDITTDKDSSRLYMLMTPPATVSPASALFGGGEVGPSELLDNTRRAGHCAVTLQDGRVLIIGGAELAPAGAGINGSDFALIHDSVLVYDMNDSGGYFDVALDADSGAPLRMSGPRAFHTATVLSDGSVLVIGGYTTFSGLDISTQLAVDLITPADKGGFLIDRVGTLNIGRAHHTATLVDGEVLVVGGETVGSDPSKRQYLNSVERFDPDLGVTSLTLTMPEARSQHVAALLDKRQVLICGGRDEDSVSSTCEVFVQVGAAAQLVPVAGMSTPRYAFAALPAPERDGAVIIAGGFIDLVQTQMTASVEFFERDLGGFDPSKATAMSQSRAQMEVLDLQSDRQLLVIGGLDPEGRAITNVDLLRPLSSRSDDYLAEPLTVLAAGRHHQASVVLPNGAVLVTAGATKPSADAASASIAQSELINLGLPSFAVAP
jgi:hypothetical protein